MGSVLLSFMKLDPQCYTDTMTSGLLKQPVEKTCPECGVLFSTTSPVQTKCSAKCREAYKERRKRMRRSQQRKDSRPWISCDTCGTKFQHHMPNTKYCSRKCRNEAVSQRSQKTRIWVSGKCLECGQWFITKHRVNGTRLCSRTCAVKHGNRKRSTALSERPCVECGITVYLEYGSRGQRFCSDRCRRRRINKYKERNHRERAQKYGVEYQPGITTIKVCNRDGWVCALCGDPINPMITWPDDLSKSLDHIVPLSKGGGHTWTNVQAAHLRCNVDKGDALPESSVSERY